MSQGIVLTDPLLDESTGCLLPDELAIVIDSDEGGRTACIFGPSGSGWLDTSVLEVVSDCPGSEA
jgi:hypothetical protein